MLKFVLALLCAVLTVSCSEISEQLAYKIHRYNLMCHCWGEEAVDKHAFAMMEACKKCGASQQAGLALTLPAPLPVQLMRSPLPMYNMPQYFSYPVHGIHAAYGKKKREVSEEERIEFLNSLAHFESEMLSKMGNLTCVLQELKVLDAFGNIDMNHCSYETLSKEYGNTPAGSDPAFLRKVADAMTDCYDIAQSWPQQSLDRNPFMKLHGRHMIFFHCQKKAENNLCMKFQLKQYCEKLTGGDVQSLYGMDKYDSAAMEIKVMHETASPEEKFVDKFFWGKPEM